MFRLYPGDSQYAVEKMINSYARDAQLELLEFRGSNLSKVFASMCSVAQSCPTLSVQTLWTVTHPAPLFMGFSQKK